MKDAFITKEQAAKMLYLGVDTNKWNGPKYYEKIPGTTREEWCEEELIMKEVSECLILPKMRIDQAVKYLRDVCGVDIVISPKFNSETGDRVGYFWRWSQRTDVNMNPKTHRSYESALIDAIEEILNQLTGNYGKSN